MRSDAEIMIDRRRRFVREVQALVAQSRAEGEAAVQAFDLDAAVVSFTRCRILADHVLPAAERAVGSAHHNPTYLRSGGPR